MLSMYSAVSRITVWSPSSTLILILCIPIFLLSLSLFSSYNSHFNRKCSIISFSAPHSYSRISMTLNLLRYLFRWQCLVHNLEIYITCFHFCMFLYSLSSVDVSGCWLMWCRCFVVIFSVFYSISQSIFIAIRIVVFWGDFILILNIMLFGFTAAFAASFICSFPSIFWYSDIHSIYILQIDLIVYNLSIIFKISLMIYWLNCHFDDSIVWIADWLSVNMYTLLCSLIFFLNMETTIWIIINFIA